MIYIHIISLRKALRQIKLIILINLYFYRFKGFILLLKDIFKILILYHLIACFNYPFNFLVILFKNINKTSRILIYLIAIKTLNLHILLIKLKIRYNNYLFKEI